VLVYQTLGCLKLTYHKEPVLKVISSKNELTSKKSALKGCSAYLYGFNGMEKDDEVKGGGNSYDFGARMQDPRLGRWLSIDKLASDYIPISPYVFGLNKPTILVDEDGNKIWDPINNEEVIVTYDSEGNAVFTLESGGEVSPEFMENGGFVLSNFGKTDFGKDRIEWLMGLNAMVEIYYEDGESTIAEGVNAVNDINMINLDNENHTWTITIWGAEIRNTDEDWRMVEAGTEISEEAFGGLVAAVFANEIGDGQPESKTLRKMFSQSRQYYYNDYVSVSYELQTLKEYSKTLDPSSTGINMDYISKQYEKNYYLQKGKKITLVKPRVYGVENGNVINLNPIKLKELSKKKITLEETKDGVVRDKEYKEVDNGREADDNTE